MRLSTILNRVEKYKRFVYGGAKFEELTDGLALVVSVRPRTNSRPECSGCGRRCATYDRMQEPRRFGFVPLWGIVVYFAYRMRRVRCPDCAAVLVERVPWCDGKNRLTTTERSFRPNGPGNQLNASLVLIRGNPSHPLNPWPIRMLRRP